MVGDDVSPLVFLLLNIFQVKSNFQRIYYAVQSFDDVVDSKYPSRNSDHDCYCKNQDEEEKCKTCFDSDLWHLSHLLSKP